MKQVHFMPLVLGLVLMLSFQNCSKSNFESAGHITSLVDSSAKTNSQIETRIQLEGFSLEEKRRICPMVMCAAPPENCHYEAESSNQVTSGDNERLCVSGCGKLVCNEERIKPVQCPMIRCQAPDVGCGYARGTAKKDENGCDTDCGAIYCEEVKNSPPKVAPMPVPLEPKMCPMYACVALEPGCQLSGIVKKDENGCNIGCGEQICEREINPINTINPKQGDGDVEINPINTINPKQGDRVVEINPIKRIDKKKLDPIFCPMYMCYKPDVLRKCEYSTAPAPIDENGCAVGCGIVACQEEM